MKKFQSTIFTLIPKDLIKGAIMAVLSAIATGITELLAGLAAVPPVVPNKQVLIHMGIVGLIAGVSYITKNFLTNSKDEFLKPEKKIDVKG